MRSPILKRFIATLFAILLFFSIFNIHKDLTYITRIYPDEYRSYYIPSSLHAKVFSLGYTNALSDLLYLWFVYYWDWYGKNVRYSYMEHTFEVMTDLDPKNQDAYIIAALLAFVPLKWDLVYKFLDKGIEKNPENYVIPYDAGNYALFSEKNYERAAKYFQIAFERNPERTTIKNLLAYSLSHKGDLETSLKYFEEILDKYKNDDSPEGNYYRFSSVLHIFEVKNEIAKRDVEKAVEKYRAKFGKNPPSLRVLKKEGFINEIPKDPLGKDYEYDPNSGTIKCVSKFNPKEVIGRW